MNCWIIGIQQGQNVQMRERKNQGRTSQRANEPGTWGESARGRMSQGVNKPKGESAWHRGWTSQRVKELGGKSARGWTSHGANEPGGKRARGRTDKGAKKPDTLPTNYLDPDVLNLSMLQTTSGVGLNTVQLPMLNICQLKNDQLNKMLAKVSEMWTKCVLRVMLIKQSYRIG